MLCFRNILVAKKFIKKKGGDYRNFLSKIFCLEMPQKFRRGIFKCVNTFGD